MWLFFRPQHGTSYGRAVWEGSNPLPVTTSGTPTCMVPPTSDWRRRSGLFTAQVGGQP
ncbi:putative phage-related protein [Bordetella avium 197N]|uniref:Phage-related protein n=1 Tax=Bordetella avium (strain 197N) TaxID=360910 RepID=Q2KZ08_BORA1|nr:putative phage-related protein [Bordetella avium 197N]